MIKIKDFIGTKSFYKMTLSIAVPMMVQNLISNFVNLLDNVMVGSLGTEEMSGVSIVNQLFFVFTLALFGAVSGAGIFTSQFHGKNDHDGIRYTIRFKTVTVILLTIIALLVFIFFGDFRNMHKPRFIIRQRNKSSKRHYARNLSFDYATLFQ